MHCCLMRKETKIPTNQERIKHFSITHNKRTNQQTDKELSEPREVNKHTRTKTIKNKITNNTKERIGNTQISILLLCFQYLFVELMITMNE